MHTQIVNVKITENLFLMWDLSAEIKKKKEQNYKLCPEALCEVGMRKDSLLHTLLFPPFRNARAGPMRWLSRGGHLCRPSDLSSIPGTRVLEGENSFPLTSACTAYCLHELPPQSSVISGNTRANPSVLVHTCDPSF